jgi:hypothetical protein
MFVLEALLTLAPRLLPIVTNRLTTRHNADDEAGDVEFEMSNFEDASTPIHRNAMTWSDWWRANKITWHDAEIPLDLNSAFEDADTDDNDTNVNKDLYSTSRKYTIAMPPHDLLYSLSVAKDFFFYIDRVSVHVYDTFSERDVVVLVDTTSLHDAANGRIVITNRDGSPFPSFLVDERVNNRFLSLRVSLWISTKHFTHFAERPLATTAAPQSEKLLSFRCASIPKHHVLRTILSSAQSPRLRWNGSRDSIVLDKNGVVSQCRTNGNSGAK